MKAFKFLLALLTACGTIAAAAAANAQAAPCATFETLSSDLAVVYSPFSPIQTVRPFVVRVTRNDPTVTSVRFILLDTTSSSAGNPRIGDAGPIGYGIQWVANTGQPVFFQGNQVVNSTNGALVTFGSGALGSLRLPAFLMTIPAGRPVTASRQIEDLAVSFQCFRGTDGGAPQTQANNRIEVALTVIPVFGAYIGSAGVNTGQIDFGPLDVNGGNPTRQIAVTSVSTLPYDVHIATDRGSQLRRSAADTDGIPYSMRFANIDAADGATLRCAAPPAPSGSTQNLQVTLDNSHTRSLPAGLYNDTITLTFTPFDGGSAPSSACQLR